MNSIFIERLDKDFVNKTTFEHWLRVGELQQKSAQKGLSISTPEAHIAQCCIDFDGALLSEDKIFKKLKLVLPQLKLN